jgi:uncharacterized membrane protein YkoI
MNTLIARVASVALILTSSIVWARDVPDAEVVALQAAGSIQPIEKLKSIALIAHPGAVITDSELDEAYGKHVYQIDLTDARGIEWNVDVDATTGKILKDHQDR